MAFITTDGVSALLSDENASEIIKAASEQSVAMRMFRTVNMGKHIFRMPVSTGLATAYFVSGPSGTSAPGRKRTTSATWERKFLTAEEVAVIIAVPDSQLSDADFDLWGELRPQVSEAIGAAVDAAVFFGAGKPASWTDDAIVSAARAAGNSFVRGSVGSQRLDVDISDTMSLVEEDGFAVNGMAADISLRGGLRGLRDADGQPIYIASVVNGQVAPDAATIYNERAMFVRNGAWDRDEATLVAGDFEKAVLGLREDISVTFSKSAVIQNVDSGAIEQNMFQQDMTAARFVIRLAWAVANPVTRMNADANTRYPFAVLRPAGASA